MGIFDECIRQELYSNEPPQSNVLGFVHHSHSAATQLFHDAVMRNGLADHWRESYGFETNESMKGLELDDSKKCCWSNIAIDILARAPEKQQVIESVAPCRRKFLWWWYYYQPVNPSLKTSLQNAAAWDPSPYDGDASL